MNPYPHRPQGPHWPHGYAPQGPGFGPPRPKPGLSGLAIALIVIGSVALLGFGGCLVGLAVLGAASESAEVDAGGSAPADSAVASASGGPFGDTAPIASGVIPAPGTVRKGRAPVNAAQAPAAPITTAAPDVAGPRDGALVGFWDGVETYVLRSDGTATKYVRQYPTASNPICWTKADLHGTWSGSDGKLKVQFSRGQWKNCRGDALAFSPLTESLSYELQSTPNSASPFGLTLWITKASGVRLGLNKMCSSEAGCSRVPEPL